MYRICVLLLGLGMLFATSTAPASAATDRVVLAGGCFWGMQAVFESLRGVTQVTAGYAGGDLTRAHYEDVATGTTGNAESVEIDFDPARISFDQLLDVYFLVAHDPTELNRQGPDDGTQYRSEIFYTSNAQRDEAQRVIAALREHKVYDAPIVTKLAPLAGFVAAELYHQDFLVHNPSSPYIVYNDLPKLRALRLRFPALVNDDAAPMRVVSKT